MGTPDFGKNRLTDLVYECVDEVYSIYLEKTGRFLEVLSDCCKDVVVYDFNGDDWPNGFWVCSKCRKEMHLDPEAGSSVYYFSDVSSGRIDETVAKWLRVDEGTNVEVTLTD